MDRPVRDHLPDPVEGHPEPHAANLPAHDRPGGREHLPPPSQQVRGPRGAVDRAARNGGRLRRLHPRRRGEAGRRDRGRQGQGPVHGRLLLLPRHERRGDHHQARQAARPPAGRRRRRCRRLPGRHRPDADGPARRPGPAQEGPLQPTRRSASSGRTSPPWAPARTSPPSPSTTSPRPATRASSAAARSSAPTARRATTSPAPAVRCRRASTRPSSPVSARSTSTRRSSPVRSRCRSSPTRCSRPRTRPT